jgi:hypothetical protein
LKDQILIVLVGWSTDDSANVADAERLRAREVAVIQFFLLMLFRRLGRPLPL